MWTNHLSIHPFYCCQFWISQWICHTFSMFPIYAFQSVLSLSMLPITLLIHYFVTQLILINSFTLAKVKKYKWTGKSSCSFCKITVTYCNSIKFAVKLNIKGASSTEKTNWKPPCGELGDVAWEAKYVPAIFFVWTKGLSSMKKTNWKPPSNCGDRNFL
jgi:hypothetical protein